MARTPRYIQPKDIALGDLVRMTYTVEDVTVSVVGTVARREHNKRATEFYSASGYLMGVDWQDGTSRLSVTRLKLAPQNDTPPLGTMEELMALAERNDNG